MIVVKFETGTQVAAIVIIFVKFKSRHDHRPSGESPQAS